jgi:hypothetical protein
VTLLVCIVFARIHIVIELFIATAAIFKTKSCGPSNKVVYDAGKYLIDTNGGTNSGWCTVLDDQEGANDDEYTVSVDLYADTEEENHLGIAYNVQDMNNFDFIYYRY